jgi:molybdate/tungstate transport system substrate-binding protein
MEKAKVIKFIAGLFILFGFGSCNQQEAKTNQGLSGDLVIFHAGSLAAPFKEIADSFMIINPGVRVLAESAGSLASIRKITDLNKPCDILASADYSLIDKLMIPKYASWNIQFAGNEMALVYHPDSRFSEKIDLNNWTSILLDPVVRFGRSDPNSDPCGYRTILSLKLAEKIYHMPGLTAQFMKKNERYIRPKEVDWLALLETGTIDYIFIYKSIAIQHKLAYLELPDSINLGNPALEEFYGHVSVEVNGNKPGETINQLGEPMVYGVCIPEKAPNKTAANAFIEFLLGDAGKHIMQNSGQTGLNPKLTNKSERLPAEIRHLIALPDTLN